MKNKYIARETRELAKELNQSEVLRCIRGTYTKLPKRDKELILKEAEAIRKGVRSHLNNDGAIEVICKLAQLLIEKGE